MALKEAKGILLNKFQIKLQHNLNKAEANKTFALTNKNI